MIHSHSIFELTMLSKSYYNNMVNILVLYSLPAMWLCYVTCTVCIINLMKYVKYVRILKSFAQSHQEGKKDPIYVFLSSRNI